MCVFLKSHSSMALVWQVEIVENARVQQTTDRYIYFSTPMYICMCVCNQKIMSDRNACKFLGLLTFWELCWLWGVPLQITKIITTTTPIAKTKCSVLRQWKRGSYSECKVQRKQKQKIPKLTTTTKRAANEWTNEAMNSWVIGVLVHKYLFHFK